MLPGCLQQPRVPFVVAANGPRAMAVAARHGRGWATYGAAVADDALGPARAQERWWELLAGTVGRFEQALAAAGREPGSVRRYLNVDAAPVYSLSSVEVLREGVGRAAALGFTDVVVHWPRPEGVYAGREDVLEDVASALPGLRTTG